MVRFTELSAARRGARRKLAAANQGATRTSILATVIGIDPEDSSRLLVSVDPADPDLSVLAGPTKVVPGALVHVEVDSAGRPIRVLGPASTRPEGLDEDAPAPAPVTPMEPLAPRELTEAEAQAIEDTADGLAEAQGRVDAAEGLLNAIGAADGPEGVAEALTDYIAIPLDQITVVDNRGADGQVIAHLYDSIIVEGLLTASEIITGDMLADGAVTARTLNVVPDEGTGGMELKPEGLRIIPNDVGEGTAINLRSDEENWISFAQDGQSTFSVSPAGELVSQQVIANDSLTYRGEELADLLTQFPRGVIAHARTTRDVIIGTESGRLLAATFVTPPDNRRIKITVRGHGGSSAPRGYFHLRQSTGTTVGPLNSLQQSWYTPKLEAGSSMSFEWSHSRNVSQWGWPNDTEITVGLFVRSMDSGNTFNFTAAQNQEIIVEDVGPTAAIVAHIPWVPSGGGGTSDGNENQTHPTRYSRKWDATGHRTYSYTGVAHVRAGQSLVQGAISGTNSRGHWFFNDSQIRSAISGADVESGSLTIRNQHAHANSGMTAVLKVHAYSSAPSTFGTATSWTSIHVPKGKATNIKLPTWILAGLKNGTIRGFSLDHGGGTSTAHYGFFSPQATLYLTYTK